MKEMYYNQQLISCLSNHCSADWRLIIILIVYFKTDNVWQWEYFAVSHYKSQLVKAEL